jgi:predicted Zn-ribbon and HTH transcriptional regulator
MRLPIPFRFGETDVTDAELSKPTAGVLADVAREAQRSMYAAMHKLVAGSVRDLSGITDRGQVSNAIKESPYKNAEYLGVMLGALMSNDTRFEGAYKCPRCGTLLVCEKVGDDDFRDDVDDIPVTYAQSSDPVRIELSFPVSMAMKSERFGSVGDVVTDIEIGHPTIRECMVAERQVGASDGSELQAAIYMQALRAVNGAEATDEYRRAVGTHLIRRMSYDDLQRIADAVDRVGLSSTIEKRCRSCGKQFHAQVNTASFFESALR